MPAFLRRVTLRHLLVFVVVLTAVSQAAVGAALYGRLQHRLEDDLARRLERVAALLTYSVDAPLVAQFQAGDETLPAYELVRRRLSAQAEAAGVTRAYVLDAEDRTLVDTETAQPPGRVRHVLLAYRRELTLARGGTAASTRLYADEGGALRLSAFAPLRTRDGRVVALMAVDAPPAFFAVLETVRREMLLLGVAALGLIALGGALVVRQVDARLGRLRDVATRAARGDLGAAAEPHATDPIGALGRDLDRLIASIIASRDHQEAVLGSVDVALVTCDAAGRVTLANPRSIALLGASGGDLRGKDLDGLLAPEPALREFARAMRHGSGATAAAELPIAGGLAGGGRVLAATASRLHGEAGGFVLSWLDVTEMRRAELRARENERLAALGGMAGGLLHELGNPLAALAMYLDLLRSLAPSAEGQELVARALREDARLREFLEDFRIFAGLAPLRVETVDLAVVLADAAEPLAFSPDATRTTRGSGHARGDARLLVHAARNLLRNALEACPGGAIAVEIDVESGEARVTVTDAGPGLSADALERILEPFHTTKPHGTGLGLMIARRVAELHGGRLEAASRPGEGARFTLRWPAGPSEHDRAPARR